MKISYITSHGIAEWVKFEPCDDEVITFSLDRALSGAITVGGKIFTLTKGEAHVPTDALENGSHTPIFETVEGCFKGESFFKSGRTVSVKPADEMLIRRLVARCGTLEKRCANLEKQVNTLEKKISGHGIFNFESERKKI